MLKYEEPNMEIIIMSDVLTDTVGVSNVGGDGGFDYYSSDDSDMNI